MAKIMIWKDTIIPASPFQRLLGKATDWSNWVIWLGIKVTLCGGMDHPYDKKVAGTDWLPPPEQYAWGREKLLSKKNVAITRRR